jgi:hypothetical protein
VVQAAVQSPFEEATQRVAEATGVTVPKRRSEQLLQEMDSNQPRWTIIIAYSNATKDSGFLKAQMPRQI